MHEYSITISIVEILKKLTNEKKLSKIEKVNFEISPITHIEPESIRFYFDYLTGEDEILKNAELIFYTKRMKIRCEDCKKTFESEEISVVCPKCGGKNTKLIDPDDIRIVSIEAS